MLGRVGWASGAGSSLRRLSWAVSVELAQQESRVESVAFPADSAVSWDRYVSWKRVPALNEHLLYSKHYFRHLSLDLHSLCVICVLEMGKVSERKRHVQGQP